MASTWSNLGLNLQGTGDNSGTWGSLTNVNLQDIDAAISGVYSITLTGNTTLAFTTNSSSTTYTDESGRNKILVLSGSLSATTVIVTVPNIDKDYVIVNNSGATVTISAGGSTTVSIATSTNAYVYVNGSNAVNFALPQAGTAGAGGTTNAIQYNNAGALAGSTNLTFNGTTLAMQTATALNLTITSLTATNATVTTETITTANITNANVTTANITSLTAVTATATTLNATTANITTANVTTANITSLTAVNTTTTSLAFTTATGGTATLTTISATTANITTANVTTANITTANVTTANVTSLTAVNATATNLNSSNINVVSYGTLKLYNTANTQYTGLNVNSGAATSVTFTLPSADGSSGQGIVTNGAGVLSFSTVLTASGIATLTNKNIQPRSTSVTSSATTLTVNVSSYDMYFVDSLSTNLTISNTTSGAVNGSKMIIRIIDDTTSRTLTWSSTFVPIGVTLPTSTVSNRYIYVGCIYRSGTGWDALAVNIQS